MKEEPVDVLDKKGAKTGQTVLKSEAHSQGLWHGGAHIWIYNDKGEVLMQLRSPNKVVRPNVWDVSVAGHIPAGKNSLETVVEEAEEELGLKVDPKDLGLIGHATYEDHMPDGWFHRVHSEIYALRKDNLKLSDLTLEEREISDARWITLKQLEKELQQHPERFSPNPQSYHIALTEIPKLLK